jgi:hypothetical protein
MCSENFIICGCEKRKLNMHTRFWSELEERETQGDIRRKINNDKQEILERTNPPIFLTVG